MVSFFDLFLVLVTGFAVGFDIREGRIPNRLILLTAIGGILLNTWKGVPQLVESFLGFGLGAGFLVIPFVFGWLGAGDVKFLGAVGAILGVQLVPRVFFYSAILGGAMALISIVFGGIKLKAFQTAWNELKLLLMSRGAVLPVAVKDRAFKGALSIPFGVAIGLGTLIAVYVDPRGEWAGF